MTDHERPRLAPALEAERDDYRALSGLAVAALVLGLFSAVALVDPRAALVSVAGIVVACLALRKIASSGGELLGRKAAIAGLLLSLLLGGVALGHCLTYRWLLASQARRVGTQWFDLIARGRPELAYQLFLAPDDRHSSGGDIWDFYCSDATRHDSLEHYLTMPEVRTLLALGPKATVRPYAVEDIDTRANENRVVTIYSVTFDRDGRGTTFLVRLTARRIPAGPAAGAGWQLVGLEGGVRPAWEGEPS
ncbi:MAG TPA: hypothetical protein VJL29_09825 [Thermoguttaceae bacterium]|nr:hypothetical protein [Thermoguttaceae bacterium]